MSNFDTLSNLTGGNPGLAARVFTACTEDNLATITATGYLNDLASDELIKETDFFFINTEATDIMSAVPGQFRAVLVGTDYDLVAV